MNKDEATGVLRKFSLKEIRILQAVLKRKNCEAVIMHRVM